MKKEYNAILEIIKLGNKEQATDKLLAVLEDRTLNWVEILGYLCYHRVAGLAYEAINAVNIRGLDFPVFFAIYMIHESQRIRVELQKEYIEIISAALVEANIEHVFLKGSVLSSTIYPVGTRAFNDIDILVSKNSIQGVKNVLYELGFLQGKYNYKSGTVDEFNKDALNQSLNTRGELAPFVKIVDEIAIKTIDVDVNFSLDWKPVDHDEAVAHFLNQRILVPINKNHSIYSLKEEHLFIHLCCHFYKDSALTDLVKKRKVLDLYKFVDIYTFIQTYFGKINPEKIFRDSVKYGFDIPVYFTLSCIIEVFPDILATNNVEILYHKYNYTNDDILSVIFDQHNPKTKMKAKSSLIDRLFSYDIIKNYK